MVELLFENLKEKPNVFEENLQKLKIQNYYNKGGRLSYNSLSNIKKSDIKDLNVISKPKLSIDDMLNSKDKIPNYNSLALNNEIINVNENSNNNIIIFNNNAGMNNSKIKTSIYKNSLNINPIQNTHQKFNSKFHPRRKSVVICNNSNQNLISKGNNKTENNLLKLNINNYKIIKKSMKSFNPKKEFIKDKLFPYKYYLCSIFIRNLDISKKNNFFSFRFAKIYIFLSQLLDITTYLCLLREFNALKKIYNDKNINLIEKAKKININSINFIKDINDCIGENKFHILAQ